MMTLVLSCFACTSDTKVSPKAHNGVLDLSDWDFERDGTVQLSGQWNFIWQKFVEPAELNTALTHNQTLIDVPAAWRNYPDPTRNASNLPLTGYATYTLRVILPPNTSALELGFASPTTLSAGHWSIWSGDGQQNLTTLQQGKPARTPKESIPQLVELYTQLTASPATNILIVGHVSNFHHARGGLNAPPKLGTIQSLRIEQTSALVLTGLILGICLIIGLYHLIIFFQQHDDLASLLFAALCASVALRELTTSNLIGHLQVAPSAETFNVLFRLEYASIPLMLITGGYFIHALIPGPLFRSVLAWFVTLPSSLLVIFPMLTMPLVFSDYLGLYQGLYALTAILMAGHLLRHLSDKTTLARWMLLAFAILMVGGVNDFLHQAQVIHTTFIVPYTFTAFIILKSAILSERSARAFREAGTLARRSVEQEATLNEERNQRVRAERSLHLELHTKVNLIANAIHHLNNPLNHIQGSMYLTQNEQSQLRTFINSLMPDDSNDPMVAAAQEQVDKHFTAIESSRHSIQDALSRASNSVTMLRALSHLDGVCYNHSNIREVWRILVQRTSLPLNTINHDGIKKNGTTSLVGHPALYAHAMELIFDFLWDALPDPNKLQVSFTTAVQADSDYHEVRIQFASAQPTLVESCSELTEQIVYLLKPYQCGLTVHSDHADLSIRARQIPESEMPKPFELI